MREVREREIKRVGGEREEGNCPRVASILKSLRKVVSRTNL